MFQAWSMAMSRRRWTVSSAPIARSLAASTTRAAPTTCCRPNNLLAGSIYGAVQDALTEYRSAEQRELGMTKTRDADVLGLLLFLQRLALNCDNGRRRGRSFLGALREFHPPAPEASGSS